MEITLQGFDRLQLGFAKAPRFVAKELEEWMGAQGLHLATEIKKRTPKDAGALQDSINSYVVQAGSLGVSAIITTPLNYAVPVELGRKNVSLQNFKIDGKIVRDKGAFMFKKAVEANKGQIQADFVRLVDHILDKIAAGAT